MAVREYFWGAELSDKKKEIVWDPDQEDQEDDLDTSGLTHFLFLKQAVLGVKAKPDERNVVEVKADDFDGNSVTQPLFSLKLGLNESTILDIGAQPPLTLRLVSGSGPVYLSGQHALEVNEDDLDLLDDEADEADESPVKVMPKAQAKKRPSSTNDGPAKKAKLDETGDSKKKAGPKAGVLDVGDDDYDSEEDEDFDASMGDDDSDEEDDSEEEDESDEEDEEDDEEKGQKKTPQQKKGSKVNGAGPKKEAKVVSKDKESPKKEKKAQLSVEQIKKLLSQSPTKPKKQMKFSNLVKHTYKINDDKVLGELWTWYKDSVLKS